MLLLANPSGQWVLSFRLGCQPSLFCSYQSDFLFFGWLAWSFTFCISYFLHDLQFPDVIKLHISNASHRLNKVRIILFEVGFEFGEQFLICGKISWTLRRVLHSHTQRLDLLPPFLSIFAFSEVEVHESSSVCVSWDWSSLLLRHTNMLKCCTFSMNLNYYYLHFSLTVFSLIICPLLFYKSCF